MLRMVTRTLPDGSVRRVHPFHISMEGMETLILCRDDADYDAMVKILCVAAWRKNVIIIIYAVVSNHCHIAVLAVNQRDAEAFALEIKRMYAMWFKRRYKGKAVLRGVDAKAIWLDSDWYVRNALAYIPRNALDNGCRVQDYRWSGYRAMFSSDTHSGAVRKVTSLTKRERERIMHTGDDLEGVTWLIDEKDELVPKSFCDYRYLEQAFEGDPAFFLKTIGSQNAAEMQNKLIDGPRIMMTDGEFQKVVEETSQRWYKADVSSLTYDRKTRLVPYLFRTTHTTIAQLARATGLDREAIARIIRRPRSGEGHISEGGSSPVEMVHSTAKGRFGGEGPGPEM